MANLLGVEFQGRPPEVATYELEVTIAPIDPSSVPLAVGEATDGLLPREDPRLNGECVDARTLEIHGNFLQLGAMVDLDQSLEPDQP